MYNKLIFFFLFFPLISTPDLFAQNKYSIFFDSNITSIKEIYESELIEYLDHIDFSKIESVSLIAYSDDVGSKKNNEVLSKKRVDNIKKIIEKKQLPVKIETLYQGMIKNDIKKEYTAKHIAYMNNNNRRIDIVPNYKYAYQDQDIHSLNMKFYPSYNSYPGERIYLDRIKFPNDRSVLSEEVAKELDRIALLLEKYKDMHVEIQGHICNYPNVYVDAIDIDTGKRELSTNRAKAVHDYFISKRIEPRRLSYKGLGSHKPLGLNIDLDNRIELMVLKI